MSASDTAETYSCKTGKNWHTYPQRKPYINKDYPKKKIKN